MVTALYNGVEINSIKDDCGKPFKFEQAWRVLRQHQKFLLANQGGQRGESTKQNPTAFTHSEQSGDTVSAEGSHQHKNPVASSHSNERPIRRKRAKLMRKKEEYIAKKLRIAEESVALQKERNDALKRHYEIMLFTSARTGCDNSEAVEYFRIIRARALTKLRREEAKSTDDEYEDEY